MSRLKTSLLMSAAAATVLMLPPGRLGGFRAGTCPGMEASPASGPRQQDLPASAAAAAAAVIVMMLFNLPACRTSCILAMPWCYLLAAAEFSRLNQVPSHWPGVDFAAARFKLGSGGRVGASILHWFAGQPEGCHGPSHHGAGGLRGSEAPDDLHVLRDSNLKQAQPLAQACQQVV